jgi:small conductance mechanosensitive channel
MDQAKQLGTKVEQKATEVKDLAAKYVPPSISVIVILVVTWLLSNWVRRTTRSGLERAKFDPAMGKFFATAVRWIVLTIGVLFCLNVFGLNPTSVAVLFAVTGLAAGLALQGSLGHMASGLMLRMSRPFKAGDVVTVAGQLGTVVEIDLFTTVLDTADGRRVIVPNGQIFRNTIENQTFHQRRRADVKVSVAANVEIEQVRALLEHAALATRGRLDEPSPSVTLAASVGATLDWEVSVWARTADLGAVQQALIQNVRDSLAEAGFEFPAPATAAAMRRSEMLSRR